MAKVPIYHLRVSAAVTGLRKREYYPVVCGTLRASVTTSITANVTCKRCLRVMSEGKTNG